nr:prothymosin alpha-like [Desmodus rotundus]
MSDMAMDTRSKITTKDLKEKQEVVEEEADNEVDEEEEEREEKEEAEDDGEEEDGVEDEEAEAPMGKWTAEGDEDDDVDSKRQRRLMRTTIEQLL